LPKSKLHLLKSMFPIYGIKVVSNTDVNKSAYVVNLAQKEVLSAIPIKPSLHTVSPKPIFDVMLLFDTQNTVEASYYLSERVSDPNRKPEPRMGHEFISKWLNRGDRIFIGTDGINIFACKLDTTTFSDLEFDAASEAILDRVDDTYLDDAIKKAPLAPTKISKVTNGYKRSRIIVQKAKRRSKYVCDFPKCGWPGFKKEGGGKFIEVHHIIPLAEKGFDTMDNVAALCPECHRKQHYSSSKLTLRSTLLSEIRRKY